MQFDNATNLFATANQGMQFSITPRQTQLRHVRLGRDQLANDGTLNNGVAETDFADVIDATGAGSNGAVMHGYGGNDALMGSSGKDDIFGDDGVVAISAAQDTMNLIACHAHSTGAAGCFSFEFTAFNERSYLCAA